MNKTFTLLMFCVFALSAKAQQTPPFQADQPFGKINQEDLELKACSFEKDANAEVLISKGDLYYDQTFNVVLEVHRRIKIFNDNGKKQADIIIPFDGGDRSEFITGLQAETVNLTDGKIEITKLDKKLVYTKSIDKVRSQMIFTFPNVKAGSIIEYKYTWNGVDYGYIPPWFYQEEIPVRYTELDTKLPDLLYFSTHTRSRIPLTKNTTSEESGSIGIGQDATPYTNECAKREMDNVPSLAEEPYMSSNADNLESISFVLTTIKPINGFVKSRADTWPKIGAALADDEDFGHQLKRKLTNEEAIITQANTLKTEDDKIAYIFNQVKNTMKWNGYDQWYTNDGTCKAWDNKTGNATEINLILYHLLKKTGISALPMIVSTRAHGKVNPTFTYIGQFNRAVVYIPVDSTKQYILDASDKYNTYNEMPDNILNSSALYIDMDNKAYDMFFVQKLTPVRRSVFITAEIKPDGKMDGTAQISCSSYRKINSVTRYKTDGETKYIDYLQDGDNNLKISALKMENMDVDTLPLLQSMNFNLDLAGSDDNYIYFNSNLLTSLYTNPFLSENRYTDIDFGYRDNLTIYGTYKIPAGYKVDALPKSTSMTMPDKSMTFRRVVAEQDGAIVIRYIIDHKQSIYFKENYPDFHEFYKKMYEMLNEQVVLKKS
jgi:hypothetical protein